LVLRRFAVCCFAVLTLLVVPNLAAATQAGSGGAALIPAPTIDKLVCDDGRVSICGRSQSLTIEGEWLGDARSVTFRGGKGRRDDRRVRVRAKSASSIVVRVPWTARSGPVGVVARGGSSKLRRVRITKPSAVTRAGTDSFFIDGPEPVRFAYLATSGSKIELVRMGDLGVLRSWPADPGADGRGEVTWNGRLGKADAPPGRYGFRVVPEGSSAGAVTKQFAMLDHIFPIRGRHDLGQGKVNGFGGGRGHQGLDMFAKCGTPLAAARGGKVIMSAYQGRAGNYLVIQRADGQSYAYMHMKERSPLRAGEKVFTGQAIGLVGQTGRADGCHLHFELWSAPGWYKGGSPIDPLPQLRLWDAWS
jgi:murein DD-endopeptidase MepM/ murein hydrolase activator NlpD